MGGDEFAVLTGNADPAAGAGRLLLSLAEPFSIDQHQIFIRASAGISCAQPGSSAESLQREAYVALYHAKQAGKGRWLKFQPSMAVTPPERLEMEKCLRSALAPPVPLLCKPLIRERKKRETVRVIPAYLHRERYTRHSDFSESCRSNTSTEI